MMRDPAKIFSEIPETAVEWRTDTVGEEETGCPWHDCQVLLRRVGLRPRASVCSSAGSSSPREIGTSPPRWCTRRPRRR